MLFNLDKKRALRNVLLTTSTAAAVLLFGSSISWAQDSNTNTAAPNDTSKDASKSSATVSEVVVTGTNIKGVKPIAPVITITRQDIDESGYATIGDVMRSLPEDFAGGNNPGTYYTGTQGVNNENISNGSSVNLFGLGSDATLTLINGSRMPSDGQYEAPDISVIPLAAIQRVEVVTDGSSAIYGADAVAGVVNFILRKDYNGLEASSYYGGATEGGDQTQIYSLLAGVSKDHWHVLVSAEYQHGDPIIDSQRSFTSHAYFGGDTLIEALTHRTVFVTGGVDLTDNISFSLDGLYSDRQSSNVADVFSFYQTEYHDPNYNISQTFDFKLPRGWNLNLVGSEASSVDQTEQQTITTKSRSNFYDTAINGVDSVDVTATGNLVTMPTGVLHTAFGGGFRAEGYKADYPGEPSEDSNVIHASRNVYYAYGEALIPLVPASTDRPGLEDLEVSASGRYEHYSDFGDTANPRLGLRYVPFAGLTLRGTWGTSFKAPSFTQMYQSTEVAYFPDSYYGGHADGLETAGGNPNLKPEKSKNWTIGLEFIPPQLKTAVFSATYFNINYKDRIVNPLTSVNASTFLTNPANGPFVILNPPITTSESLVSNTPLFINEVGGVFNPSSVDAIIVDTYQNAESQQDSGVDVSYRESFLLGIGQFRTFANATWNHLTEQLTPGSVFQTLSGTVSNTPKFRGRGGATWSKSGLAVTAIINYTSSETNNLVTPAQTIGSWTTVDANLTYKFPESEGLRHSLAFTVAVTNLFDRHPPYVNDSGVYYGNIDFDSLNASAIGRFVAVKVTKKW